MKTDLQLKADVTAELAWDPAVNSAGIGVLVHDGVVTLTGHLDTFAEKVAAERAVRRVAGVRGLAIELDVKLVAMTGRADSSLARHADHVLDSAVEEEACPLNLAPTASTTATLAIGDALAVALLEARGFTSTDFARSHPGGTLGRKLLLHVADVMRTGDELPVVTPDVSLAEGLVVMSKKGLGMCVVVEDGRMLGVFTDGDLRRVLDREANVHKTSMREVMTSPGKRVTATELAAEAAHLMEKHRITALPVVDAQGTLVGALNVHDLLRAGVL